MDYKFKNSLKTARIVIPYADLKEGTPISISGAVTNGSGAFGIVKKLGDKFVGNGGFFCEAEVIVAGYLDENECEKACGLTYTDEMKSALPLIVFVDEFLPETPDELPTVGVGDTGKVLTVGASGLEWDEIDDPLPVPTTEGDVLVVGKVADPSVVILPEQTVECNDGWYFPTGVAPSTLEDGMKVCITVNGDSVISTVIIGSGGLIEIPFSPVGDGGLSYDEVDGWGFWDDGYYEGEPITISVTGTKLGWEAGSVGGAYDAIVSIYHDNNSASGYVITIEKGDYESLVEILDSKRTPVLFVKEWNELINLYANTSVTSVYSYDSDRIDFRVAMPGNIQFSFIALKWKSNNSIIIT